MTTQITTHKTRSERPWLPKRRERFHVILKRHSRRHVAGPFKCEALVLAGGYPHLIEARDAEGDAWQFLLREWRFEPVDTKGGR